MFELAKRNLRLYFRDKSSVFFSLLAVFIVLGLYIFFLGDTLKSSFSAVPDVDLLIGSWVMAGILSVAAVTTTLGAFGTMVDDRSKKITKDFGASPLRRFDIAGGYIASSFLIGLIMSLITFVLAQIYILTLGGPILAIPAMAKLLGYILLSVFASSAMMLFIVSFFYSANAFTTASTVIGTLIGFITGIYIPIGSLPGAVQTVIKLFPISHAASLMRQVLLEGPMATAFAGAPSAYVEEFRKTMGITYYFGETQVTALGSILILLGTGLLFFALAIWNIRRKRT